ncbi:MAG: Fe-S cluster assembly ATPase SufC [Bacteroidota bacterium]|nr:Fe-S cluster assembly ATPase SufC [Bacteroidota bacterium]
MLKVKNLKVSIDGSPILKGLDLEVNTGEVHAIMGPNGSGKSTLAAVIAGKEEYEIDEGEIIYNNENLIDCAAEERAHNGIFLSFQYPVEIPGISVSNFIKTSISEMRKANGLPSMKSSDLLKLMREKMALLDIKEGYLSRSMNQGFSGGEKKRNEIFQMAMLEPKLSILDETDSGLDIDAIRIVSNGVNKLRTQKNSTIVITHYQRLLNYIVPDFVHVLHDGKIIDSGDKNLALELEDKGYDWLIKK